MAWKNLEEDLAEEFGGFSEEQFYQAQLVLEQRITHISTGKQARKQDRVKASPERYRLLLEKQRQRDKGRHVREKAADPEAYRAKRNAKWLRLKADPVKYAAHLEKQRQRDRLNKRGTTRKRPPKHK